MKIRDIFSDLPTLETERLILRKFTLDDVENMLVMLLNQKYQDLYLGRRIAPLKTHIIL